MKCETSEDGPRLSSSPTTGSRRKAVERGLGLIRESLDIVRLEEEDIVKIFAASTLLLCSACSAT